MPGWPGSPGRGLKQRGRQLARREMVTLASAPIDVAPVLRTALFDAVKSVVLTSATLATSRGGRHGFEYFRSRLGLEGGRELLLDSPFDFRRQARLYVETHLGDPNDLEHFVPAACCSITTIAATAASNSRRAPLAGAAARCVAGAVSNDTAAGLDGSIACDRQRLAV